MLQEWTKAPRSGLWIAEPLRAGPLKPPSPRARSEGLYIWKGLGTRRGLSLEFYLPRGSAVCQALKSMANVQKKPATKRMRVAMSGSGKDF